MRADHNPKTHRTVPHLLSSYTIYPRNIQHKRRNRPAKKCNRTHKLNEQPKGENETHRKVQGNRRAASSKN